MPASRYRRRASASPTRLDEHRFEVGAKHLVIAVRTLVVKGGGEDLALFELSEELLAARRAAELVAQRRREPAEHAGLHQEVADVDRELVEDVAGEVLADEPGPHAELGKHASAVACRLSPSGEVEQLQACGPALGASGEFGQLVGAERLTVEVEEQALDLP